MIINNSDRKVIISGYGSRFTAKCKKARQAKRTAGLSMYSVMDYTGSRKVIVANIAYELPLVAPFFPGFSKPDAAQGFPFFPSPVLGGLLVVFF